MKRFFLLVFAAITAAGLWACPAMPGAFRHVKMVDGTTVKAFIHGDEFFNYETDENEFLGSVPKRFSSAAQQHAEQQA